MNALKARTVRTAVTAAVAIATATTLVAAPASAAPGRIDAGQVSLDRGTLPGWTVHAPSASGAVVANVRVTGVNWASQVEFGDLGVAGASAELARASALRIPESSGYKGVKASVIGLKVSPTTVCGVPASLATAEIRIDGGPVRGDRLRVLVIDTKPQSYFLSAVPFEAPDRQGQADAAERSLTAKR